MKFLFATLLALPTLSACSSHPSITVARIGTMPPPGAYHILRGSPQPTRIETALASKLEAGGFTVDDKASLVVQVSFSAPPPKTGLLLGEATEPQWLLPPTRSKSKGMRRLLITMTDSATGKEIYRAHGREVYRKKKADSDEALQRSVFALIP